MAPKIAPPFSQTAGNAHKHQSNSSRQRAAIPKHEIAFVNLTDSSGPIQDAEKRKLVRVHVMRGYQKQKQALDAEDYQRFHGEPFEHPHILPTGSIPQPQNEPLVHETFGVSGPTLSSEASWIPSLGNRPNQAFPESGTIYEQQVDGEWIPTSALSPHSIQFSSIDMAYQPTNMNYEHDQFHSSLDTQQSHDPFDYFRQPEFVPEEIECPTISQSLSLVFSPLNSGMLDPFNAMPGLRNARAQALMYHYNKVLVNTLIPVNPKDKWFNHAISDEGLFHATMLHSAGHNALLSGNNDLADPYQLKLEAMRIVNRRLDDPILSISDLTIGTVACLVLFENQSGNVEASNIHMEGLRRMINLRGGLQNLGLSGVLQRKILWAETCNAMLSLSKPHLNLPQAGSNTELNLSDLPFSRSSSSPNSCACTDDLTSIISSLRTISFTPPIHAVDGLISDHLYLVERQLVTLLSSQTSSSDTNSTNIIHVSSSCQTINPAFFLASLAYLYLSLRDFPSQAPLFTFLTTRLTGALFEADENLISGLNRESSLTGVWEEEQGGLGLSVLTWVLTVGAIAAGERTQRNGFVRELERVLAILAITEFEEFAEGLGRVVWMKRSTDRDLVLRTLWSEIMDFRRLKEDIGTSEGILEQGFYSDLLR